MRRIKSSDNIVETDPEIERTLRILRRAQRQRRVEEQQQAATMAANDDTRPLKEFAAPTARGLQSGIARPEITATQFTIPPILLSR